MQGSDFVFIAKGTYAHVYERDGETVYRVEPAEFAEDMTRQLEVNLFLTEQNFGPCFARLLDVQRVRNTGLAGRVRRDIDARLREWDLKASETEIVISVVEFGNRGSLQEFIPDVNAQKVWNDFTLMLLFSVWNANICSGFRHRDIKAENVVVKKLPAPRTFSFSVGKKYNFAVTTQYVPLLIDYGFSSVDTTPDKMAQFQMGTLAALPPEFLVYELARYVAADDEIRVDHHGQFPETSFDFWSISLMMLLKKMDLYNLGALRPRVVECNIEDISRRKRDRAKLSLFVRLCCLMKALDNGLLPKNLSSYYSTGFLNEKFRRRLKRFDSEHHLSEAYRARLKRFVRSEKDRRAFATLLHWDPRRRCCGGRIYKLFELLARTNENRPDEIYTGVPRKLKEF